jgi:hypothetical protein
MTDKDDVQRYRNGSQKPLFDLFEAARGREAKSIQELTKWLASPRGRAAIARHNATDDKTKITTRTE